MLPAFFQPRNIEHLALAEQKRILLTSRISFVGVILLLLYYPTFILLERWLLLSVNTFTIFCLIVSILLNRNTKNFLLAKLILCVEPVLHIFYMSSTQGASIHLYSISCVSIPFLVFDFNKQKFYAIGLASLNILCVAFCQLVIFYPEFNPFNLTPLPSWFEYLNWVGSCTLVLVLVSVFALTNSENEQKVLSMLTESQQLTKELQETVTQLYQSENRLEKLNQELASREEELRQNLEELQATQESMQKEKQYAEQMKERFELAIEGTNDGIWDWDLQKNEIYISPKLKEMVGYKEHELSNTMESFYTIIHPDYRELVQETLQKCEKDIIQKYALEIKLLCKDGSTKWALSRGGAKYDSNGKMVRITGFRTDITERKLQQEKLEKLNQELASREEELRQNLEELQATQESLLKEKQTVDELNKNLMIREIELKKNVEELTYLQEQMSLQNKALIEARKKMEIQNQELIAREEELKQNLEELHATQEQMRLAQAEAERNAMNANKIFEAAPVGLFISKVSNRTIIQANQAMAKLLKIPVYEIIGRTTLSFYASEEQAKAVFGKLTQSGRFDDEEIDLILDDGSVITVLVSAQVMTLNNEKVIVAGLNDITALKKAQAELTDLAANLAKKVEEQTAEIKRSFAQMVQNEKMAALGQLVAGVAHEINTPIGAIKASAENMQENLPNLIHQTLNTDIPVHFTETFQSAVNYMLHEKLSLTSREERQYRKQITELLTQHNIENASDIAFSLVQIGLIKNIESFIPIFQQENYETILELLSRIGRLKVNIDTILLATNKTKKIVSALKSYVHKQAEDTLSLTNINESIETVLILYHNQMKHGIEVITDFADLPEIYTYADELSQVWTNVIVNALQAMQYKGTLTIKTELVNDEVIVSINDNGPGIPKEIQDKIFEPFFTTKVQGEGTGLGLDICKKIVEKHNGKMYFTSEPGNTTFYITISTKLSQSLLQS